MKNDNTSPRPRCENNPTKGRYSRHFYALLILGGNVYVFRRKFRVAASFIKILINTVEKSSPFLSIDIFWEWKDNTLLM